VDLVLQGDRFEAAQRFKLAHRAGQIERFGQSNIVGNGLVNQFVQRFDADRLQHRPEVRVASADVSIDEAVAVVHQVAGRDIYGFLVLHGNSVVTQSGVAKMAVHA
jgi:hypothetical protein